MLKDLDNKFACQRVDISQNIISIKHEVTSLEKFPNVLCPLIHEWKFPKKFS